MKACLSLITLLLFNICVFAQQVTLSGTVNDDQGKPVPFASVYIKGTTKGTSANGDGQYKLALATGNYDVQFKAVGYREVSKHIELNTSQTVNVQLQTEAYQLSGVVVRVGGEDPAYAIMRKAIKKRKFYENEVKAYTCQVYVKGLQRLLQAPKKFLGQDIDKITRENGLDSNRRGILYLSESESKLSFQAPNNTHEEMISSKVDGSNQAFSFNRASEMNIDFYQNIQNWEGVSSRPLVSPLASDAFLYYNYKWMGATLENGETINKIRVSPKRAHDPCFEGDIYILEDSWRLYGVDLAVTKKAGINIVDTVRLGQQFYQVKPGVWMPSTNKFEFVGGLFGFRVNGYYIAVYKDYDLAPTFGKKDFIETLRITKDVNKRDSSYWSAERPIPLTTEEKVDYTKKAVLAKKRESKEYLDSLDRVNNKFGVGKYLTSGYFHRNRYDHEYFRLDAPLTSVLFNTVQGFAIDYGGSFTKQIDSANNKYLQLSAKVGYGFSNHIFTGAASAVIPVGDNTLSLGGGSQIIDLNNRDAITSAINTSYSLLHRENFEKLYQKQYGSAALSRRIVGGWLATIYTEWADRKWLPNSSSFSIFKPKGKEYTSNNPYLPQDDVPLFPENQAFKVSFRTTYNFSNKYQTFPNGRRYQPSPYPTIGFTYVKAIKDVFGSDADYSRVSMDISKENIDMGMYGNTSFYLEAGKFFDVKSIYFPDFRQFAGLQETVYKPSADRFLLLDFYNFSTYTKYFEGHLEHNFSGFILNKIPLVRKLKFQEIVDVNYLTSPELKNYVEWGAGLQYLNLRLMYGHSYNSGMNATHAIRLGISL